jgi:transposase
VDSAGQTIPVVTPLTGEGQEAAICLAVLGAANSPFAAAPWSQSLPEWIGAHLRAFAALGGVPQVLVPDTLKAAVPRAHRDAPTRKRTSEALAPHYGIALVPARAATPRDQAQGAVGVQVVARWMLARLRHQTFFSLPEVHTALTALLGARNLRPCKQLPGSRASLFAAIDRPALPPLPAQP